MNKSLKVDNYIITTPLEKIIFDLKTKYATNKLKDVRVGNYDITLTCVNDNHANGQEKNPDAHINLDRDSAPYGWYHCFACEASCSFIGFIAYFFNSSYTFAKNWLIKNYGVESESSIVIDDPIVLNSTAKTFLDETLLDKYQTWTPYLAKRKISRETASGLKIRYDPVSRFCIFPIYDEFGNLAMLARRSIDTKYFHMDSNAQKEVYCLNIIRKNHLNTAVICEGLFDCATSYEYGVPAIATLGTPSMYQIKKINESCLSSLYLCMDNDNSGKKFTEFLKNNLSSRILLYEVALPKNKKDINDLEKEEFLNCIKKAI